MLRKISFPTHAPFYSLAPDKSYAIPELPGIYTMLLNSAFRLEQVYHGSPHALPEEECQADIIAAVQRMQRARGIPATKTPEIVTFRNHTPLNIMVSKEAIRDGFCKELCELQGERHTWYTGAPVRTQDSSVLWRFMEDLWLRILKEL